MLFLHSSEEAEALRAAWGGQVGLALRLLLLAAVKGAPFHLDRAVVHLQAVLREGRRLVLQNGTQRFPAASEDAQQ